MKKIINLLALWTLKLFHFTSTYDLEVNSPHCLLHISYDFSSENMVFNQTIKLRNTGNCLLIEGKLQISAAVVTCTTKSWDITEESVDDFNNSLYTLYWNAYSPHCSLYISDGTDRENVFNNQELFLLLLIISFILKALILDWAGILRAGIRFWWLLGVKG